jgi:DNA mismatch repair protein MutL
MRKDAQGRQPWEALFEVLEEERKGDAENEQGPASGGSADPAPGSSTGTAPGNSDAVEEPQALWESAQHAAPDAEIVQLHRRFLLCPVKSGFLLVDQRIAHERVLFEKYRRRLAEGAGASQRQLFPAQIDLGPADAATLKELLPAFQALGFDIAPADAGEGQFLVHGTPADCAEMDGRLAVDELLAYFRRLGEVQELGPRDRVARSLARSYAIPHGKTLSLEARRELIDALFACEAPFAGPGGNPTFLTFNNTELAQRFHRRHA